uniref:trypsin n=1 Tax=Erpetoichthys calabaricus TaxID=27687 RepID=A0A8C4TG88_ERPCA
CHCVLVVLLLAVSTVILFPDVLAERIINGNQAKPHSHPYMAALFKGFMLNCGGFLIHKEFILTAAHCEAYPMTVRLGAHNLSKDEPSIQEIKVKKEDVFHHPKYNKYNQWNDIMLVKLRPAAKLTKGVNIIKIPKTDQNVKVDTKCSVAGWGKMATRGMTSDVLMEVPVKVENQSECASRKNYHNLNANMICATGDGIKGTCKVRTSVAPYSGGPLVCDKPSNALGIVSFSIRDSCEDPNRISLYTRVSAYLPWIKTILKSKAD